MPKSLPYDRVGAMLRNQRIITEADIQELVKGRTSELRAQATEKLCHKLSVFPLDETDTGLAKKIIALLAQDKSEMVRQTLASNLHSSKLLDADVVGRLALDVNTVAGPILRYAPNLDDETIFELILNGTPAKKSAIAKRASLKPDQIEALAEYGGMEPVIELARNQNVNWTDTAINNAVLRFAFETDMQIAFGLRENLPAFAAEALVKRASGVAADIITTRHALPVSLAIELALASEKPGIDLHEQSTNTLEPARLAQVCALNGVLDGDFLIRSMSLGAISFAEHALAELSGIPHWRVRPILGQAKTRGISTLLSHAGIAPRYAPIVARLVEVITATTVDYKDRHTKKTRLIERILTDTLINIDRETKAYLSNRHEAYYAFAKIQRDITSPVYANTTPKRRQHTATNQPSQMGLMT